MNPDIARTAVEPSPVFRHPAAAAWIRLLGSGCLVAAVLALVGCDTLGVALGTRLRLTDIPIRSLSVSLSPQPGLSPGAEGQLVVVATAADGRQLVTVGTEGGKVLFDSFTIEASLVSVNGRGVVGLPSDPRISEARTPHVRVRVVGQPAVVGDLDIPVRHDTRFTARFAGEPGADGKKGRDGERGSDGASGSLDPDGSSRGGNGADGSAGSDGERGGDGGPGPMVRIWIGMAPADPPRLRVRVVADDQERFFLIDPQGGSLWVESNGGPGGSGGDGGRGGPGGSGGSGVPAGMSGFSGMDGSRGWSGSDGPPGRIVVRVDPLAQSYLDRFLFSSQGRGRATVPEIRVEPVGALW